MKPPVSWAEGGEAGLTEGKCSPCRVVSGTGVVLWTEYYSVFRFLDIPARDCQVFFNIRASIVGCKYVPSSRTFKMLFSFPSMVDDYPMTYHVFILEPRKKRTPKP